MVCNRCIAAVEKVFDDFEIETLSIDLGEVETKNEWNKIEIQQLNERLEIIGFQILEDSSKKLIEKIKKHIILKINDLDIPEDFILSKFLSEKLHKEYSAISKIFSQNGNVTLEQYFILQKIEKVKELLLYDELSLTEISHLMEYSSVAHLSHQFKKITGLTPTYFKKMKQYKKRIMLEEL